VTAPTTPDVGERYTDDAARQVMEWTGQEWTMVCPLCDVAMTARNPGGWLCCPQCTTRAVDAGRR